ncbi:MAG: hypothetical protein K0U76_08375 [Actinomycetia bacterium]|nr:hypothetical protein [Actinomycetes bacterium]MCH9761756.1 hypothetical protein [Actinomycetes bacterium]
MRGHRVLPGAVLLGKVLPGANRPALHRLDPHPSGRVVAVPAAQPVRAQLVVATLAAPNDSHPWQGPRLA